MHLRLLFASLFLTTPLLLAGCSGQEAEDDVQDALGIDEGSETETIERETEEFIERDTSAIIDPDTGEVISETVEETPVTVELETEVEREIDVESGETETTTTGTPPPGLDDDN